jgi:hypothetical protein
VRGLPTSEKLGCISFSDEFRNLQS